MRKTATPPSGPDVSREQRCTCGALLARVVGLTIEIKCKRCKNCSTFSFDELGITASDPS